MLFLDISNITFAAASNYLKSKASYFRHITYIATDEGWLYPRVVLDLFSRKVVGWSMKPHIKTKLVGDALRIVWFQRRPEAVNIAAMNSS